MPALNLSSVNSFYGSTHYLNKIFQIGMYKSKHEKNKEIFVFKVMQLTDDRIMPHALYRSF